jgi:hypothetical protein
MKRKKTLLDKIFYVRNRERLGSLGILIYKAAKNKKKRGK